MVQQELSNLPCPVPTRDIPSGTFLRGPELQSVQGRGLRLTCCVVSDRGHSPLESVLGEPRVGEHGGTTG